MDSKIIVTEDNSKTLLIPEINESYHSTKGAVTESKHIFIKEGLAYLNLKETTIFEMGFGTGLNALLSLDYATSNNSSIKYHTIEAFPLPYNKVSKIGYPESLKLEKYSSLFKSMHEAKNEDELVLDKLFSFKKILQRMEDYKVKENYYDLIYYDAFSPAKNPVLWSKEVLTTIYNGLKHHGALVTYCAQGEFKRTLKTIGFDVEAVPGPPGKREITRAIKSC
jgi:tRNA U34 5-methylaminomethyl-2-thiouridine-forming methyltransferase MnmC